MKHATNSKRAIGRLVLTLAVAAGAGAAVALSGTTQAADNGKLGPMEFAKAAKVWQQVCGSCHNLRGPKELTDAEWDVAVGQMEVRAGLPPEQARLIDAFLKASN